MIVMACCMSSYCSHAAPVDSYVLNSFWLNRLPLHINALPSDWQPPMHSRAIALPASSFDYMHVNPAAGTSLTLTQQQDVCNCCHIWRGCIDLTGAYRALQLQQALHSSIPLLTLVA